MDWRAAPLTDAEDLTGHQLKAGRRPPAPERNAQILAKPGREKEETEEDQTCTRDSSWGCGTEAGVRSPVGATARDSGQSEAPAERGGSPATVLRPSRPQHHIPGQGRASSAMRRGGGGSWRLGLESNPRAGSAVDCGEVARADLREGNALGGRPDSVEARRGCRATPGPSLHCSLSLPTWPPPAAGQQRTTERLVACA